MRSNPQRRRRSDECHVALWENEEDRCESLVDVVIEPQDQQCCQTSLPPAKLLRSEPIAQHISSSVSSPAFLSDTANSQFDRLVNSLVEMVSHELCPTASTVEVIPLAKLPILGEALGWPAGNGLPFFSLLFAVCDGEALYLREAGGLRRADWMSAARRYSISSLADLVSAIRLQVKHSFAQEQLSCLSSVRDPLHVSNPKVVCLAFHHFVFDLIAFYHLGFPAVKSPLELSNGGFRYAPVSESVKGLQMSLGYLSPIVSPLCGFLLTVSKGVVAAPSHCPPARGYPQGRRLLSISRDQWNMIYCFCQAMDYPTMSRYDQNDCWPSLLDDFVQWLRPGGEEFK